MQACSNEEALRYLVWSMPKAFWEIFGLRLAGEDCIKLSPFTKRGKHTVNVVIPSVRSLVYVAGCSIVHGMMDVTIRKILFVVVLYISRYT